MTTFTRRFIILVGLPLIAGVAWARTDIPWDGVYFGGNFADASSSTCNSWALKGALMDLLIASEFNLRNCSKSDALVGGLQVGENFQSKRLVWGIGADLDFWSAKNFSQSLKFSGAAPPAGTYVFSNKQSPSGFAVIGPRIGYAGDTWLPYLRVGTIVAMGSHGSTLFYTPAAATRASPTRRRSTTTSPRCWPGPRPAVQVTRHPTR